MKPHIYAMWGSPLTEANVAAAADLEAAAVPEGERAEARAYLLKALRHQIAIAVCADERGEGPVIARERMILPGWDAATVKEHRWPYPEADLLPFTHVVLLEGPEVEGAVTDPFFFNGKEIKGKFGLCLFNEKTGEYMHFHCPNCCQLIVAEINELQRQWQGSATAPKEATHEAPRQLQ